MLTAVRADGLRFYNLFVEDLDDEFELLSALLAYEGLANAWLQQTPEGKRMEAEREAERERIRKGGAPSSGLAIHRPTVSTTGEERRAARRLERERLAREKELNGG